MTYVIALPCVDVKDKSCIEECPVDCIYEGDRMLYIQPDECVEIRAIDVHLSARIVHGGADVGHGGLEDTVGRRVGDHQRGELA